MMYTLFKYTWRLSQCHYLTGILSLNEQILISLIIKSLTILKKNNVFKITNLHSVSIWFSFYFCQVFQVRKISGADNGKIFAMKVLKKVRGSWPSYSLYENITYLSTHTDILVYFIQSHTCWEVGHCLIASTWEDYWYTADCGPCI